LAFRIREQASEASRRRAEELEADYHRAAVPAVVHHWGSFQVEALAAGHHRRAGAVAVCLLQRRLVAVAPAYVQEGPASMILGGEQG
jgi:hypothetical protein